MTTEDSAPQHSSEVQQQSQQQPNTNPHPTQTQPQTQPPVVPPHPTCRYRKQLTIKNEPSFLVNTTIPLLILSSHPKTARYAKQLRNVSNGWLLTVIFVSAWFAVMFWWYLPLEAMEVATVLDMCDHLSVDVSITVLWSTYVVGGIASILTNLSVSVKLLNHLVFVLLEGDCQEIPQSSSSALSSPPSSLLLSSLSSLEGPGGPALVGSSRHTTSGNNATVGGDAVASPKVYKDASGLFGMLIV